MAGMATMIVSAARLPTHNREITRPLILLVDNDASVRRFVCAVVAYAMASSETVADVMEAADPSEAVSIACVLNGSIDLLISDINLKSGASGMDLARELSFTNPAMRILLMSATDSWNNRMPNGWHFLSKPFRMSELVRLINSLCLNTA